MSGETTLESVTGTGKNGKKKKSSNADSNELSDVEANQGMLAANDSDNNDDDDDGYNDSGDTAGQSKGSRAQQPPAPPVPQWRRNVCAVFGPNPWLWWLPVATVSAAELYPMVHPVLLTPLPSVGAVRQALAAAEAEAAARSGNSNGGNAASQL